MRRAPRSADNNGEPSDTKRRICAAAMRCFAQHGNKAASMRMVAAAAGVSVGLVQHHFGSKARLIEAVDAELIALLRDTAPPTNPPPPDIVTDVGQRATSLMAQQPEALDYLAYLLISKAPTGQVIFDMLLEIGKVHWTHLSQQDRVRTDLDPTWGPLNPLVLILGTLVFRSHIDRNLPAPLSSPAQLSIWETAVNRLIENGQLRQPR